MKKIVIILSGGLILSACHNNSSRPATPVTDEHKGHAMAAAAAGYADSVNAGLIKEDTMKSSPHRVAMNTVGTIHVHMEYSSPGVKDRVIWGGLVAWDKVWVAGAHHATSVRFSKEVVIDGKKIPAGTYAFFAIPRKNEWTLILNTRYDQHLADEYNEKEDIIRVNVTAVTHAPTPRLTYVVTKTGEKQGAIQLLWENVQVSLPFETIE